MLRLKAVLFATLAALALIAAACGGGGGGSDESAGGGDDVTAADGSGGGDKSADDSARQDADSGDQLVSNAGAALGKSAEAFEQDVESLQAEISFSFDIGEVSMTGAGNFSYQAPDSIYMTMSFGDGGNSGPDLSQLGNFEMLLTGGQIYMNTGLTGWMTMSLEDLGAESADFSDLLAGHSPVDYESLIDSAGGDIEYVGEEEVDGRAAAHYRLSLSLADMMDALSGAMGDAGLTTEDMGAAEMTGDMVLDLWLDSETLLPAKMTATGSASIEGEAMTMDMQARFFGYNEPVDMPAPPADAKPFEEMFDGLGMGEDLNMEDMFGGAGQ